MPLRDASMKSWRARLPAYIHLPIVSAEGNDCNVNTNVSAFLATVILGGMVQAHTLWRKATLGSKDQLVLRILLLRQGCMAAMLVKEQLELKDIIKTAQQVILVQRKLKLTKHIYHRWTYSTTTTKLIITVPINIWDESNLTDMFTFVRLSCTSKWSKNSQG